MATAKITKRVVDSLQKGETVWDSEVTGFGVRRQKSAKVYMLKHRNQHGRQGWITIGRHGSPWTPETARAEAKRLLRQIEAGEDPGEARDATKTALTIDMLCDRFLVDVEARRKESTADEYRKLLQRQVRTAFGKLKIAEVTHAKATAWHAGKASTPYEANRGAVVAKRMWNLAIRWGLTTENPFKGIELYREKPREKVAKASELEAVGRVMGAMAIPDPVRRCIVLLATTGCRSGEARRLRWEDTNLDAGTAVLRDTKNHEDRVLGLNAVAVAALTPSRRESGWVCPSVSDERKPLAEGTLGSYWRRIRADAGCADLRVHDLRHGLATQAARDGASALLVRDLLGHKTLAMANRYVARVAEEAAAAQRKAGMTIGAALVGAASAQVVPLPERRRG